MASLRHVLGGWVVAGNYLLQSGQRYTPSQVTGIASSTAAGDFYDAAFLGAFVGTDTARPFLGNLNAPATSVGIFAGDACNLFGSIGPGGPEPICNGSIAPTQLISLNAINQSQAGLLDINGNPVAPVTATSAQVPLYRERGNSPNHLWHAFWEYAQKHCPGCNFKYR